MSDNIKLLKNYLLYFLVGVLICLVGLTDVFAASYTYVADVPNITMQLVETDYASSPIENPYNASYAFGQVLQIDYIISNYSFSADTNYQLETHLPNQVLTNADTYTVVGLNGENCLISYQSPNTIMNNEHYPRWAFQCPHATQTITISVRNSSNQYLWSGVDVFKWSSAVLSSSTTSLSGSGTDSDNIINNNNQNTQSIINNQNQNTQDIINSQKSCTNYDKSNIVISNKYLNQYGAETSRNTTGITDYIRISETSEVSRIKSFNFSDNIYLCFYTVNKDLISCIQENTADNYSLSTVSYSVPSTSSYIRFTIKPETNLPQFKICDNGSQAITNSVNDLNDSINDDDVDDASSEAADFFGDFETDTFGLTSIITAPLNLINSLLSRNCSPLQLPLPYLSNKYLILPCMYDIYSQHFGALLSLYQAITYGIVAYWVIVRIFNQVKDFKNPEHDEIEVMDL